MMKIFGTVLVLALALLLIMYYMYRIVFCHPLKKRPDVHRIPESNLYKAYLDIMEENIQDMENTPYDNVSIVSFDGCRLCGKLYSIKAGAPLVIFFHGYHGTAAWDGYGFFKICKNNGLNLMLVDERAHGKSEGSAITFGIKERYDCKMWTEYAAKRFGGDTDIFLAGVSMGAASVMMASELGLPANVKGIVADCGYSEPSAIIKETIRKMNFPVKPIYFFIDLGARLFGYFNLEEASPLEAVKKLEIPILFIHGKQDSVVPLLMNDELYESCTGRKERVLIEKADHANSALTNYETYEKAVMDFMGNILKYGGKMKLEFKKFSDFQRGTMLDLLKDSYSFECRYERDWIKNWEDADAFFYDNLQIADKCGFITTLNEIPIGFICWDPRNMPEYIEIGHNCIAAKYKGNKYGKQQLQEAVNRISQKKAKKIIVTTDEQLIPAQKNYESVGFKFIRKHENEWNSEYAGKLMDYEMILEN